MTTNDEQLRELVKEIWNNGVFYEKGADWPENEERINEFVERAEQAVLAARIEQMGQVRSLANDLACKDDTMIGSETLRNYHYTNALDLLRHDLDPDYDIRWLEPLYDEWKSEKEAQKGSE